MTNTSLLSRRLNHPILEGIFPLRVRILFLANTRKQECDLDYFFPHAATLTTAESHM